MEKLKINEIFHSIQGESSFQGLPFIFIRLTGCSLRCSYCDTTYAFFKGTLMTVDDIIQYIQQYNCTHVLITGGEPLDQPDVSILIKNLLKLKFTVLVETAGNHSLVPYPRKAHYIIDIKLPSSKMHDQMHPELFNELTESDELKFVIQNKNDFDYALQCIKNIPINLPEKQILFSPVFKKLNPDILAKWMLENHVNATLQIQMHKYIWPDIDRGV